MHIVRIVYRILASCFYTLFLRISIFKNYSLTSVFTKPKYLGVFSFMRFLAQEKLTKQESFGKSAN